MKSDLSARGASPVAILKLFGLSSMTAGRNLEAQNVPTLLALSGLRLHHLCFFSFANLGMV